jgi:hypothetical protein
MKNYLYLMRLSVAILVAVIKTHAGNSQTLLNENFSYPSGALLTANGWNAHSSAGVNPVVVSPQGLVFQDYPSSDIGLSALLANNGEDVNKTFTTVITGSVFCAFLVKVTTFDNDYFLHLAGSPVGNNYKGRVFTSGTGNSFNFGLSKGSGTVVFTTGSSFTTGSTYLMILKYSIVEGASNDMVSLYIITGSIPSTEPTTPSIGPLTDAGQTDLTNVSSVAMRQYSVAQNIQVDGIRVATKWEDLVGIVTCNENLTMKNPVIYPVPVSEELTISNVHNGTLIEIFDITGKKVISTKTEATNNYKIPVKNLLPGLYMLRITTSGGIHIMRFVKS